MRPRDRGPMPPTPSFNVATAPGARAWVKSTVYFAAAEHSDRSNIGIGCDGGHNTWSGDSPGGRLFFFLQTLVFRARDIELRNVVECAFQPDVRDPWELLVCAPGVAVQQDGPDNVAARYLY